MPNQNEAAEQQEDIIHEHIKRRNLQCMYSISTVIDRRKDSADMQSVKNSLTALSELMETDIQLEADDAARKKQLHKMFNDIEEKYIRAIRQCQTYLDNKAYAVFYSRDRYKKVQRTLELLKKEADNIAMLRQDMETNPHKYRDVEGKSVLELSYELQRSRERKRAEGRQIAMLELKDFIEAVSNDKESRLLFKNGKIWRTDDSKVKKEWKTASRENYDMADQMIHLLLMGQSISTPSQQKRLRRNLLKGLGADNKNKTAPPISISKIRTLLVRYNGATSQVDGILLKYANYAHKKPSEQPQEYRMARRVDSMLKNTFVEGKKKKEYIAFKKKTKRRILSIMEASQKQNVYHTLKLSEEELDYLVYGRLQTVRDRVYESLRRIRYMKMHLGQRPITEPDDAELKNLIALAVSEAVTDRDDIKQMMSLQISRFEQRQCIKSDKRLDAVSKALDLETFSGIDVAKLRDYVQDHHKRLAGLNDKEREDTLVTVAKIVQNVQEMTRLLGKGLRDGIADNEKDIFAQYVSENYALYTEHKENIEKLKNAFPHNSNVFAALDNMKKSEATGFKIKDVFKFIQQMDQIGQFVKKPEKVFEAFLPESKTVEIITEADALSFAISEIEPKAKSLITSIFIDGKPSKLIKNAGDQISNGIFSLHRAMEELAKRGSDTYLLNFNGTSINLTKDDADIVSIEIGQNKVELPYDARYWRDRFEMDICSNIEKYNKVNINAFMGAVLARDRLIADRGGRTDLNRALYEQFLIKSLDIESAQLANISTHDLRIVAVMCCQDITKEAKKNIITNYLDPSKKNRNQGTDAINSQAALESLVALENRRKQLAKSPRQNDKIRLVNEAVKLYEEEHDGGWANEEKALLNIVSGLFLNRRTAQRYNKDGTYTVERLTDAIKENIDDFVTVLNMGYGDRARYKMQFERMFGDFGTAIDAVYNLALDVVRTKKVGIDVGFFGGEDGQTDKETVLAALESEEVKAAIGKSTDAMKKAVDDISNYVQDQLLDIAKQIDSDSENKWKEISDYTIEELVQKGMTGNEGEGAFNKKVLSGYIKQASAVDKQKMVASVFKNAVKPNLDELVTDEQIEAAYGRLMAGYIKGAGPLLHKMLQGVPVSEMPIAVQAMVADVRSNLMPVDPDIVNARLQSIVDESGGAIERIEKLGVLGSASVGQTILVKIYEKGKTEGTEKVVKILKPDIQNTMERERAFMESCARQVDIDTYVKKNGREPEDKEHYEGGMLKTYKGKEKAILKELNLRLESENVELGSVYNDDLYHIRSMKSDTNAKQTMHAIVLEKADGIPLDKFFRQVAAKRAEIEHKVTQIKEDRDKKSLNVYGTVKELHKLREGLIEKQQYLSGLVRKWLDESLFGSGFFHGDLHAGNIMIDGDGLTVIDFGNVGKLSKDDRKDIINMVAGAIRFNQGKVIEHIYNMLPKASRDIFDENRNELTRKIRTIIKKEDGSPVEKLLVILNELQNEKIGVPANLYNFIQCFVRIIGTTTDYRAMIDDVGISIKNVMYAEQKGKIEDDPENGIMPVIREKIIERTNRNEWHEKLEDAVNEVIENADPDIKILNKFCDTIHSPRDGGGVFVFDAEKDGDSRVNNLLMNPAAADCFTLFSNYDFCEAFSRLSYGDDFDLDDARSVIDWVGMQFNGLIAFFADKHVSIAVTKYSQRRDELQNRLATADAKEAEKLRDDIAKCDAHIKNLQKLLQDAPGYAEEFIPKRDRLKAELASGHVDNEFLKDTVNWVFDIFRDKFATIYCENDLEAAFMKNIFDACRITLPPQQFDEDMTDEEKAHYRKWEGDAKKARENYERLAKEVYRMSNPKSYIERMADVVVDEQSYKQLGESLKSWFMDEELEGTALKAAYDSIDTVRKARGAVDVNTKEVKDFIQAFHVSLNKRAAKLQDISDASRRIADSGKEEAIIEGLFEARFADILWKLDGMAIPYMRTHKITDEEKALLRENKIRRKSDYMNRLYDEIEGKDLLNLTDEIISKTKSYESTISHSEKSGEGFDGDALRKARQACDKAVYDILKTIAGIDFGEVEGRKIDRLFKEFGEKQSARALRELLAETGSYIQNSFVETRYSEVKDEHGKSLLDRVFSSKLASLSKLPKFKEIEFDFNIPDIKDVNGKNLTLKEVLKRGADIKFVPPTEVENKLLADAPKIAFIAFKKKLAEEGFNTKEKIIFQSRDGSFLDMSKKENLEYFYGCNRIIATQGKLQKQTCMAKESFMSKVYRFVVEESETAYAKALNDFDKQISKKLEETKNIGDVNCMMKACEALDNMLNKGEKVFDVDKLKSAIKDFSDLEVPKAADMDADAAKSRLDKIANIKTVIAAFSSEVTEKQKADTEEKKACEKLAEAVLKFAEKGEKIYEAVNEICKKRIDTVTNEMKNLAESEDYAQFKTRLEQTVAEKKMPAGPVAMRYLTHEIVASLKGAEDGKKVNENNIRDFIKETTLFTKLTNIAPDKDGKNPALDIWSKLLNSADDRKKLIDAANVEIAKKAVEKKVVVKENDNMIDNKNVKEDVKENGSKNDNVKEDARENSNKGSQKGGRVF